MTTPAPQTLTVTASDQHRFNATWYPTSEPDAPIVIFMSALGTPGKVYRHLGKELVQHGVQVCTPDWRGIDSSSVRAGRASDFGYRHLVEVDLPALIASVRQVCPNAPIWLGGHSLGGQVALLGATALADPIAGVLLIACGSVDIACYRGRARWGVRTLAALSGILGPLLGYFPGTQLGFGGREAAGVMRDWSHVAHTGRYQLAGSSIDYEGRMPMIQLPVLALSFAADQWAPEPAMKALLSKASKAPVTHWHWHAEQTNGLALDHYTWIKQPALLAPAVAQFIKA